MYEMLQKAKRERHIEMLIGPQPSLSLWHLGSLAPETKGQYIQAYKQAEKGHRRDQSMGIILPLKTFIHTSRPNS